MTTTDQSVNTTATSKYKKLEMSFSKLSLNNFSFYIINDETEKYSKHDKSKDYIDSRISSVCSNGSF